MLSKDEFNTLLAQRGNLIIDGALATQLEALGHNLDHPLWSGITLRDDTRSIVDVHWDYFKAGADIAITASYQASFTGLREHLQISEDEARDLVRTSASLAHDARGMAYTSDGITRKLLVAGSVGPYGAYLADGSEYRGDYSKTKKEFQDFHRLRIQTLIEAEVDLLAIETMPQLEEIQAVLELLQNEFPTAIAWLGCTLRDDQHISDGASLEKLCSLANTYTDQLVAIGINCVPIDLVASTLRHLRPLTQLPLLCYPNSGEQWDAANHQWLDKAAPMARTEELLRQWHAEGARLIGGCCRTGPAYISDLANAASSRGGK